MYTAAFLFGVFLSLSVPIDRLMVWQFLLGEHMFKAWAVAVFLLMVSFSVQAEENRAPRFAVLDWFPFGWTENGVQKGILIEMVQALQSELSLEANVVLAPVPRVLRGIDVGEYDFTFTYRDPKMMSGVTYLADMGCLRSAVVSLKSKPVRAFQDMNGMRLAYPGGGYFAIRFASLFEHKRVEVAQTYIMFRMALRNRLDAFIINDAVWQGYRHDLYPGFKVPAKRWDEFAPPFYMEELPLAVSISLKSKHHSLANRISGIMDSSNFRTILRAIYSSYKLPHAMNCLSSNGGD